MIRSRGNEIPKQKEMSCSLYDMFLELCHTSTGNTSVCSSRQTPCYFRLLLYSLLSSPFVCQNYHVTRSSLPCKAMEKHIEFTKWVITQGVTINGIAAHKFPGRGLGIIAEKNLKVRTATVDQIDFPLLCRSMSNFFVISMSILLLYLHNRADSIQLSFVLSISSEKCAFKFQWLSILPWQGKRTSCIF